MIRIIPSLPVFKYIDTCRECGCHVASYLPASCGIGACRIKVCSWCWWVYPAEFRMNTAQMPLVCPYLPEVEAAIRKVQRGE